MPAPRLLRDPRVTVRRALRRHRRPLAAVTAGLGMLLALTALRTGPLPDTTMTPIDDVRAVGVGEVIVPITLSSSTLAGVLALGDIVDVVGYRGTDTTDATVIATRVRVVGLPVVGSSFSASSSSVILVAAPESRALALSAASANGGVGVLIRGKRPSEVDSAP